MTPATAARGVNHRQARYRPPARLAVWAYRALLALPALVALAWFLSQLPRIDLIAFTVTCASVLAAVMLWVSILGSPPGTMRALAEATTPEQKAAAFDAGARATRAPSMLGAIALDRAVFELHRANPGDAIWLCETWLASPWLSPSLRLSALATLVVARVANGELAEAEAAARGLPAALEASLAYLPNPHDEPGLRDLAAHDRGLALFAAAVLAARAGRHDELLAATAGEWVPVEASVARPGAPALVRAFRCADASVHPVRMHVLRALRAFAFTERGAAGDPGRAAAERDAGAPYPVADVTYLASHWERLRAFLAEPAEDHSTRTSSSALTITTIA